jgi:hypothetical protein
VVGAAAVVLEHIVTSTRRGSAASARALPQSAVRSTVLACIDHLEHVLRLARIAAGGAEPEHGAAYLLGGISDLRAELRSLRATTTK